MEVIIFCVTIGIVLNFASFGMGLAIGRESERLDKRRCGRGNKRKHADRTDNTVASMGVDRDHIPDDKRTFSVGQPIYDKDGHIMGWLGIGLYHHLDYSCETVRVPSEYWQICLPTEYCEEGKKVYTYWQNKERENG